MKRIASCIAVSTLLLSVAPRLAADVKTQHKTTFQLGGMLGSIANRFAGDAAKDGAVSTVAVKGTRQLRSSSQSGRIIDLTEEKVYDLDIRRKEYRVTTFAELRKQWQDAQAKATKEAKGGGGDQPADPKQEGKQYEVSFTVKESGERKTIAGHNTKETVITVTLHEKGKSLEEGGGMVMTTSLWLTPKIAALDEIAAFDLKFNKAIYGDIFTAGDAAQMSMLMAQYPSMKELSEKLAVESRKLEGTALLTTMTVEAVKSAEEAKQGQSSGGGGGGLMGRLANRIAKPSGGGDARTKIMTSGDEVLSVETTVTAEDTAIPAGFKEKK